MAIEVSKPIRCILGPLFTLSWVIRKQPLQAVLTAPMAVFSRTITPGAMTTLYCAFSDAAQPSRLAYDTKKAHELWNLSKQTVRDKTS